MGAPSLPDPAAGADPAARDAGGTGGDQRRARRDLLVALAAPVVAMAGLGWRLLTTVAIPGAVDHPSQYARMEWFRTAMAEGRDPLGFTYAFGGGYPDLQLYPPGVASLGWFFADVVHLGPARGYWAVLVVAWFLPGVAGALTLRWTGARAVTAALGGLVVGVASFGYSGTRGGVAIGVVGSRLSLGATMLTFGLLVRFVRRSREPDGRPSRGHPLPALAAIAAAAFASGWFHGFHLPALALTLVAVGVLARRSGTGVLAPLLAAGAGLMLSGWWWLTGLAVRDLAVPIERAPGQSGVDLLLQPAFDSYGGIDWLIAVTAAVLAVVRLHRQGDLRSTRPTAIGGLDGPGLVLLPVAASAAAFLVALLDAAVGPGHLDPSRVVDGLYLWVPLLAATAVDTLDAPAHPVSAGANVTARRRAAAVGAAIGIGIGIVWFGLQARGLPPTAFVDTLADVEARGPAELWPILRAGEGRVVFTFSSFEDESAIASLTHLRTGREPLVGGPLQAVLQHGPGATGLVGHGHDYDNRALLGVSWVAMRDDPAALAKVHAWLVELRVTEVVSERRSGAGLPVQPADVLATAPARFRSVGRSGALEVWHVEGADPAVVSGERVRLLPSAYWDPVDPGSRAPLPIVGVDSFGEAIVDRPAALELHAAAPVTAARGAILVGFAALLAGAVVAARRSIRSG